MNIFKTALVLLILVVVLPLQRASAEDKPVNPSVQAVTHQPLSVTSAELDLPIVGKLFSMSVEQAASLYQTLPAEQSEAMLRAMKEKFGLAGWFKQPWHYYKTIGCYRLEDKHEGLIRIYESDGKICGVDIYWKNLPEEEVHQLISHFDPEGSKNESARSHYARALSIDGLSSTIHITRKKRGATQFRVWISPLSLYLSRNDPPEHVAQGLRSVWRIVPGMTMKEVGLVYPLNDPAVDLILTAETENSQTYTLKLYGVIEGERRGSLVDGWKTAHIFKMVDGKVTEVTHHGKPKIRLNELD